MSPCALVTGSKLHGDLSPVTEVNMHNKWVYKPEFAERTISGFDPISGAQAFSARMDFTPGQCPRLALPPITGKCPVEPDEGQASSDGSSSCTVSCLKLEIQSEGHILATNLLSNGNQGLEFRVHAYLAS